MTKVLKEKITAPSLLLFATDTGRAALDLGSYFIGKPWYNRLPKGNGQPVVILPGFMASDASSFLIRKFLNNQGFEAYPWNLGRNYGGVEYVIRAIESIEELKHKHDSKVSLVGWSLGGVYAREIARRHPELIEQVITLGSPFGGLTENNNAAWFYEFISGRKVSDVDPDFLAALPEPPPVPSTAVFSKFDGIVSWKVCMEKESPKTQNIEVLCSHTGYGLSAPIMMILADRLAQQSGTWNPFAPKLCQMPFFPKLIFA